MDNSGKQALVLKEISHQMDPGIILDLIAAPPDAVRVLLRDGRMFLARLDGDRNLRLDEIDGVC